MDWAVAMMWMAVPQQRAMQEGNPSSDTHRHRWTYKKKDEITLLELAQSHEVEAVYNDCPSPMPMDCANTLGHSDQAAASNASRDCPGALAAL